MNSRGRREACLLLCEDDDVFDIPPMQIDPRGLPPPILASEPGSFAQHTMHVRVPAIVRETSALNNFPADVNHALEDLASEIESGPVQFLREDAPDRAFWQEVWRDYAGRPWLEAPWYLAESYAYRRILEATRYFQPGLWQGFDPFRAKKLTELEPGVAPRLVDATLRDLPGGLRERFETLLYASLWGNRIDLSYAVSAQVGRAARLEDERANLLVDDAGRVWDFLRERPRCRVAILADNSGTELLMDLALADFLLTNGLAAQIEVHLKPQPFFVSDAMLPDVEAGVAALVRSGEKARALSRRLHAHVTNGLLRLTMHWFYTTCLFYFQLPNDLRAHLSAADLAIVKGDANYRRLLGDAHWPPAASFEQATAYFPSSFVVLRALKAEIITGLRQDQAEQLDQVDPQWRVNGKRGVVQARL
jgi:uncharacterized protein with ATP-grasp and redox domains